MKLTPEMLASVDGLPAREAAARLGVGKTTITDARAKRRVTKNSPLVVELSEQDRKVLKAAAGKKFSLEDKGGSLLIESQDSVPQTKEHIEERMRARGFDPEQYSFTYRFSEWEAQTAEGVQTLYAARAGAVERKASESREKMSIDELNAAIAAYIAPAVSDTPGEMPENTFVFCFADPQIGKTDINGGTNDTITRFMNSLAHAESLLAEEPTSLIIWADLGDGIENFCNTSSQRQTNDLNLVEQVRTLRRLQLEGLLRLSKFAPVIHVSVPSNHSQNRVGFQQPASTAHDDWGIEVQEQLSEAYELAKDTGKFANEIYFVRPDDHLESVSVKVPGDLTLGFVHGHRSNAQNGLENWWAGQTLGRQPTADADILLVGHFHNYSVRSVGKERYIITTPSLDNGSSWFTVSRGNVATAGVLTLRIEGGKFRDAIIA